MNAERVEGGGLGPFFGFGFGFGLGEGGANASEAYLDHMWDCGTWGVFLVINRATR